MILETIDQANRAPMLWENAEQARQDILAWAGAAIPLPLGIIATATAIALIASKAAPQLMCGL